MGGGARSERTRAARPPNGAGGIDEGVAAMATTLGQGVSPSSVMGASAPDCASAAPLSSTEATQSVAARSQETARACATGTAHALTRATSPANQGLARRRPRCGPWAEDLVS